MYNKFGFIIIILNAEKTQTPFMLSLMVVKRQMPFMTLRWVLKYNSP